MSSVDVIVVVVAVAAIAMLGWYFFAPRQHLAGPKAHGIWSREGRRPARASMTGRYCSAETD